MKLKISKVYKMPRSKIPSPARSQGVISTPRKHLRRTRSVSSPAGPVLRLSSIIESYKVSPMPSRQSVLNDDTDIEMPRRGSWWKKIDDNSRDVLKLLESKELVEINNVAEEFDVEILSQESKNYTLELPESSDGESISSIVIPQRKLFAQKDNQPQIKFKQIKNNRETLQKLNKSYLDQDKEVKVGRKTLFSQPSKPRTKPVFPAALLNMSANKTANKSKEIPAAKVKGQVRSLFGTRPGTKRKNTFADFIVSESEDEILDIQPKVFGFEKKNDSIRQASSMSRHSPTASIDLEMDDWKLLPSSTMVENQIDEVVSPIKKIKLSNLLENRDSDITDSNNATSKNKKVNKSFHSKNKSINVSNNNYVDDKSNEINITPRNATTNNIRITRSMLNSLRKNSGITSNTSKSLNKTKIQAQSNRDKSNETKFDKSNKSLRNSDKIEEPQNILIDHSDPKKYFSLEYDNDDNKDILEIGSSINNDNKSLKDKTTSNMDNIEKTSSEKICRDSFLEQDKSINKICENQSELLYNKQNSKDSNEMSNNSKIQNTNHEISNIVGLNKNSSKLQKINKSIEKDLSKSKSIRNSVEEYNEHSRINNLQKETASLKQSVNKDIEKNIKPGKPSQNLNEENAGDQEMESDNEENEYDNKSEVHSDTEEEINELTQKENNDHSEIEEHESEEKIYESKQEENKSQKGNVTKEETDNVEQDVINENIADKGIKEIMLDDQRDNIENSNQVTLSNVTQDTTGRHKKKIKSPEVVLHNKTKHIDSFTVQGRSTSVRKTKSIIFHDKLGAVKSFERSTGFSDATVNSSAEGSGWDSHRTTRKTLRQTFGKDFTPRKSLRALVMEKTAKLQANYNEVVVNNIEVPQGNSTQYDQVQVDSYEETGLVQNGQNIEVVQGNQRNEEVPIEQDQQCEVSGITEGLQDINTIDQLEETELPKERDEREQSEEEDEKEQFEKRDETEQSEQINDMDQYENEDRDESEPFEETEGIEQSEEIEDMEESDNREEIDESEEMEESEERVKMGQYKEKEEMEQSEEAEEMEQSEEKEEIEQSEKREEMEQFEEREEMEESEERVHMEQSEERVDMEQSEEREEMEQSEEGQDVEHCEYEEKDLTVLNDESDNDVPKRSRQTSLETYLQKIKEDIAEKRRKMQEELRNSLKNPKRESLNLFKAPQRTVRRIMKVQKPKAKQLKSVLPLELVPSEVFEEMKYKPPKRFQPNNASWITKRLYKFLENKLEPKYDYKARIRAEKLVEGIYAFTKEVRRHDSVRSEGIEEVKREMARLDIVKTHFDFYEFCHEFFPREIRIKIVPDIVNNISLPRHGVFSDILR